MEEPKLSRDFREMLFAFSGARVEFLLVGAYALSAHGLVRATADLDLWVRRSEENAVRVHHALVSFGAPADHFQVEDFLKPESVVQVGIPPLRVDVITSVSGIEFDEAWAERQILSLDGVEVPVLSRKHLIANKRATGRPKDALDVKWLESGERTS